MRLTPAARHRGSRHSIAVVSGLKNVLFCDWRPETGPPRAGIEFRLRAEKRGAAADAAEDSLAMLVEIAPGKSGLSAGMAGDIKGIR